MEFFRGRARIKQKKCEKITIPLCKDVGYSLTYMPNRFGHKTQFDAGLIIHQFSPLVLINCSSLLKHFICSLYAPLCDPVYHKTVEPCRSLCEEVRNKCEKVMVENGFNWPSHLECSNFPTRDNNKICMKPNESNKTIARSNTKRDESLLTTVKPDMKNEEPPRLITPKRNVNVPLVTNNVLTASKSSGVIPTRKGRGCYCMCKEPFVHPNSTQRLDEEIPPCALPCKSYFFSKNQQNFVSFWLALWSIISTISALAAVLTFLIDRKRFVYTERPMIFISLCYVFVGLGYIIRMIYGHESVACNSQTKLIRYSATGPAQCTAVFILTYFFGNVAWIWWVVLAMNWFLSTGLSWSATAVSSYSQYFHFIAWLIPTVQTMAILAMAAIDGDPVSGLCSVGNHDNNTLTIFVIAPLLIYTMLSLSFFVAGIIAVCQTKKRKHLVSKLGVFSFLLFIPAIVLLACHFYEHGNKEIWEKSTNCPCIKKQVKPYFAVFLLKYSMSLIIGLVTCFWVLESQTFESWKKFTKKLCKLQVFSFNKKMNNNNVVEQKYYSQDQHLLMAQTHQQQQQPTQYLLRHHLQNGSGPVLL